MKWNKLHRKVWLDARLRVHPVGVRCVLADLLCLTDEDGFATGAREDWALLSGIPRADFDAALTVLERLGLIVSDGDRIGIVMAMEDSAYSLSRSAGGVAARDAGVMPKRCPKDAQAMPSEASASPLVSGIESSGQSVVGSGKGSSQSRRARKIDPATYPLPAALDFPDVRAALVDYLATRKGGVWDEKLAAIRVRELSEWGRVRSIAALKHSAGYQGLFEPHGSAKANTPPEPRQPSQAEIEAKRQHALEADAWARMYGKGPYSGQPKNVDPARSQAGLRASGTGG